ncbi:hypothetical protein V2G26_003572 [Clonostachys chloroleuca]
MCAGMPTERAGGRPEGPGRIPAASPARPRKLFGILVQVSRAKQPYLSFRLVRMGGCLTKGTERHLALTISEWSYSRFGHSPAT